ncbi:MAG TPA: hypothetical protein VN933_04965 [Candidatus Eremiobacteraceae bacterium]|jgi:hypothetical protein|nr:hypothetical protein [Candidatus Eremiobacteraceae bacterium]
MTSDSTYVIKRGLHFTALACAFALLAVVFCGSAQAASSAVYISQSGGGAGDGSSCANAKPASFFNSGSNWGSTIGAGTTVHLCGTITTGLTAQGSGSSGNPITIQWESGASLSVCSTNGSLQLPGRQWLVIDFGGNSTAITCPNNGSGLGSQIVASGITDSFGQPYSNVEIRNGTIGPIYKKSGSGSDGLNTYGIYTSGGSGNHFHNISFTDSEKGVFFALGSTSSGNEIDHNSFVNIGAGIYYACGSSSCNDSGGKLHANDFTVGINWGNSNDTTHMESIHIFTNGGSSSITGLQIYDNNTHGAWPTIGGTAAYFLEQAVPGSSGSMSGDIFDNICTLTGGSGAPGDGCYFIASNNNTFGIYNNVADCVSVSNNSGIGMELDGNSGDNFTVKNNVIMNCNTAIYDPNGGGTYTFANNDYYNIGSQGWVYQGSFMSFSQWQSKTGDSSSSTSNPGLNSDYTIASASSFAHSSGVDLTSVGDTLLDTAKPTAIGASASAAGVARPGTGAWDLGPYALSGSASSGSPTPPAPPTNLTVTVTTQ